MSNDFEQTGFLFGSNSVFIEELYQKYQNDPSSVDASWREFFDEQNSFTPLKSTAKIISQGELNEDKTSDKEVSAVGNTGVPSAAESALKARFMIMSYREHGHQLAKLDPLGLEVMKTHNELKLNIEDFGFTKNQLSEKVDISGKFGDISTCSVVELVEVLERAYSGSIAAEFSHVENSREKEWLYKQLETAHTSDALQSDKKKKILKDLVEIEGFEQYLHTKFPGAKRFSVEGGDTFIVCLEAAISHFAKNDSDEVVLGLAHRGRLSTLTKVMQKPYRAVLSEFTGGSTFPTNLDISGDVKYHMGYSSDRATESGNIHLSLTPNPSHLEAVNPVVAGKVRAKQDSLGRNREKVVGMLVHGDAAFCGQGIVAESLVMSGLKPYEVGGIFHVVINNQIGFTANPHDSRPGRYCTEVAKMVGAPIIHVNGDDAESVILATKIACDYRKKFAKDVVVDIVCYRKYGHNEGDEPMYTQSVMYNIIKTKKTPAAIYSEKLISESVINEEYYPTLKQEFKAYLDNEFKQIESYEPRAQWLEGAWSGFDRSDSEKLSTGVKESVLKKLCKKLCTIPESFSINSKLKKLFDNRYKSISSDQSLDWAAAEQLAFATLLQDGTNIRITGQDAGRGTFSHRHAVLHSQANSSTYEPLNNISKDQAFFEIADSNLSEYGVLGFEYGYSLVNPKNLVVWEAQFGDFCNGAQIIFDQFISSAETKWLRMSGLVCLLPHGFEGQGPEHSSARIERFLQLCAEDNMQVVYPTTPASIFHLLRRQILRKVRKPLIVMSPKSLLRHKLAVSDIKEIDEGTSFLPIIDEIDNDIPVKSVKKIIFCSGKVYYDLLASRRENGVKDVAIVRLEQLYPFEEDVIVKIMKKYKNATSYIWCQEEPKNMGAWKYMRPNMESALKEAGIRKTIDFVGRAKSASPAVGYLYAHNKQQECLVKEALGI